MRRSLFTLLLRQGLVYDTEVDNFEHALWSAVSANVYDSGKYTEITKPAIKRFLYGFTEFTNEGEHELTGSQTWVARFKGKEEKYVCRQLVSKERTRPDLISVGSLWG